MSCSLCEKKGEIVYVIMNGWMNIWENFKM